MLDAQTNSLLQVELNTISSSFAGLRCLVSELHRYLLSHYGEYLKLDSSRVPANESASQFADALAKAWKEYNDPRAVIMVVVQGEERNMYDQHCLCLRLKEKYGVLTIQKTLTEIQAEGRLQPDATLLINEKSVAVIYFRAGYTPNDYPSESVTRSSFSFYFNFTVNCSCSIIILTQRHTMHDAQTHMLIISLICRDTHEWDATLLMEQSTAIKCPSISYHLAGTKKIQQELAKPNVLERFLDDKDDVVKLQKCFAGLWSLDDLKIMKDAIERPELFFLKPQREGGGNNIYGVEVKQKLQKLLKEGSEELAAYILMQRIFPAPSPAYMVEDGILHEDHATSELGIYGAYLRNKEKVIMNEQCGYLTRTKVSSSNEGGVVAGFGVLDSVFSLMNPCFLT